jgi:uncharacterized protein YbjT (DUF2867 family)
MYPSGMRIVINTPSSQIGRTVAQYLLETGEAPVLLSRSPAKVQDLVGRGASVVEGNLDDERALSRAFEGADALFWLTPPDLRPDHYDWATGLGRRAAEIAAARGVKRAVVLSSMGAQHGRGTGPVSPLLEIERAFGSALSDVTVLRPGFFMENLYRDLETIARDGAIYGAAPADQRSPWVATRDIGLRAGQILRDGTWKGQRVLGVHGPQDLSYNDAARILSRELGRSVRYVELDIASFRAGAVGAGLPPFLADIFAEFYTALREGRLDSAEPRDEATTTPTTLVEFVRTELASRIAPLVHGGKRFMVTLVTRPEVRPEDVQPHLAAEGQRFGALLREGAIVRGDLAATRRRGWLVVRGADADAALATVRTLPLSRFWDLEACEMTPEH